MSVITYNKLVRDRIPEIIENDNKRCDIRILDDAEYLAMIDAKLDEELAEYHKDQNLEELADILEVVYAAAKARGYSIEELENLRKQKADKRGGFDKKIFLESVTEK
ncbi:MAG: nucleoside triphosphate pyrophosphohydrolase [Butyrivibrio sp.]|uniref:nucleoside triphosphate pyrophosphohydrolase n=1 Tax=Butyrivibrio sp. TaxID=28121 RepID=UPI001B0F19FC|nr:nucleoside triphosphate pyrophosphohydrolase [Butyrivibrio sp.]MBO6242230.1 nucleoside triphosphate pyrophosphohydrolase [Butyrivibrio sp.]